MTIIKISDEDFYEKFEEELKINKDIINFRRKDFENSTFLGLTASAEHVDKVAYLFEKGANIYLLNDDKYNVLHEATTYAFICIKNKTKDINNGYQIFKLLLNWEAEQRAFYPVKYKKQILLKDQENDLDMTSLARCERNETIYKELQKAIDEAESHYEKCKTAKEHGIELEPYHRQFLPSFLKAQYEKENIYPIEVSIKAEGTWSKKIKGEGGKIQPLVRKSNPKVENTFTGFFRSLLGNHSSSDKIKTH